MDYTKKLQIDAVASDVQNLVQRQITSPQAVYDLFYHLLDDAKHKVIGLALNDSMSPWFIEVIGLGGPDILQSLKVVDLFKIAAVHDTPYIILLMNHPTETELIEPSTEDLEKIKEIERQAGVLDIHLVDFLIIGKDSFWSFSKHPHPIPNT